MLKFISNDGRKIQSVFSDLTGRQQVPTGELIEMEAVAAIYYDAAVINLMKRFHKTAKDKTKAMEFGFYCAPIRDQNILCRAKRPAANLLTLPALLGRLDPTFILMYETLSQDFFVADYSSSRQSFVRLVDALKVLHFDGMLQVMRICMNQEKRNIFYFLAVAENRVLEKEAADRRMAASLYRPPEPVDQVLDPEQRRHLADMQRRSFAEGDI